MYLINLSFYVIYSFQLVDASTLKKEVAVGVDLMVVRELTGGQCATNSTRDAWIGFSSVSGFPCKHVFKFSS